MTVSGAVISEAEDRQEVFRCLKLGAADYLVKPLRLQELRNIWTRVWWHQVTLLIQAVPGESAPGYLRIFLGTCRGHRTQSASKRQTLQLRDRNVSEKECALGHAGNTFAECRG